MCPVGQQILRAQASGKFGVPSDESQHQLGLLGIIDRTQPDHLQVAVEFQLALLVQHIGNAARHPGGKVAPGRTQHDHPATGHVLAAVIAHALNHSRGAAVAYAEALARQTANVGLAAGGTVERYVAGDHVLVGRKGRFARRAHNEFPA